MSVDIKNVSKKSQLNESTQILCKNDCGYYGNSIQWNGYCSICYRQLISKQQDEAVALSKEQSTSPSKNIWNEATNFTKFSSKKKQSVDKSSHRFNIFRKSSSQADLHTENHMSLNENDNYSSNEFQKNLKLDKIFLQQIDIDSIKQKFPQLYVQLHRKMNNFLDQYIDLLRDKVTNLKQYEIIQEFYKQMSAYIQNHSSIKSYQNTSSSADTSTSSVHSISILNDEVDKFQESLMVYVETYITNVLYDYVFPLIMAEFEDNDIKLQKHIRNLYWVTNDMIGTSLDENSIIYREFYEESLNYLIQMDSKRTPHEKMLCITECSNNIYKALKVATNNKQKQNFAASADEYLPAFIYLVLKVNPTLLYSNMTYITRFAFEKRVLQGEHAYHFCSLNAIITHIENLNASNLNLAQEQFDKYCLGLVNENNSSIKIVQTNLKLLKELEEKQDLLKSEAIKLDADMNEFYKQMKNKVQNVIITSELNQKYVSKNNLLLAGFGQTDEEPVTKILANANVADVDEAKDKCCDEYPVTSTETILIASNLEPILELS